MAVMGLHYALRNIPNHTKFMLLKKFMRQGGESTISGNSLLRKLSPARSFRESTINFVLLVGRSRTSTAVLRAC